MRRVTAYAFAIRDEHLGLGVALAAAALGVGWNAVSSLYLFTHTDVGTDARRTSPSAAGLSRLNRRSGWAP